MLENEVKKDSQDKENLSYTREFQIKNTSKKRNWKRIVIPFLIIAAVSFVAVALLLTLRVVDVKIGG